MKRLLVAAVEASCREFSGSGIQLAAYINWNVWVCTSTAQIA
jgi:hypothetical protein